VIEHALEYQVAAILEAQGEAVEAADPLHVVVRVQEAINLGAELRVGIDDQHDANQELLLYDQAMRRRETRRDMNLPTCIAQYFIKVDANTSGVHEEDLSP
jgi:hypothetical protein